MDINMPRDERHRGDPAASWPRIPDVVVILCSTYDVGDLPADAGDQRRCRVREQGAARRRPAAPAVGAPRRRAGRRRADGAEPACAQVGQASGIEPCTVAPWPGLGVPADAYRRWRRAGRPCSRSPWPRAGRRHVEARAVVADREQQAARLLPHPHLDGRVRARAWPRSAAPPGSRSRPRPRRRPGSGRCRRRRSRGPRAGCGWRRRVSACAEAVVGQQRRIDAVGQLAQLLDRDLAGPRPADRASRPAASGLVGRACRGPAAG